MLHSMTIENYKSIEKATLEVGHLTVLVGPNNAGKSNLLDAFAFLADLAQRDRTAVEERGGFQDVVWRGDLDRHVAFEVCGTIGSDHDGTARSFAYRAEVAGTAREWRVHGERFTIRTGEEPVELLARESNSTAVFHSERGRELLSTGSRPQGLAVDVAADLLDPRIPSVLAAFAQDLRHWRRYELSPAAMRRAVPVKRDLLLSPEGANLSTVLHELYTGHREAFEEIEDTLRGVVPGLSRLTAATGQPGQTYVEVRERDNPFPVPAWSLADGVLKLLALLCVAYSPGSPSVICIEEPENFLHPHALKLVVDALRSVPETRRVVMSTHSPVLLDYVEPQEVRVVERQSAGTVVRSITGPDELVGALKALGVGEAWYAGHFGGVPQP